MHGDLPRSTLRRQGVRPACCSCSLAALEPTDGCGLGPVTADSEGGVGAVLDAVATPESQQWR